MSCWHASWTVASCLTAAVAGVAGSGNAAAGGTGGGIADDIADVVLGQADMAYPFANRTDARGVVRPSSVAVDTSATPYRLYVVDTGNRRVLGYKAPLASERPVRADLVIGQPDPYCGFFNETEAGAARLLTPLCAAVDAEGNLYVSDAGYHRILEFDRPFETDTRADRVFGQGESLDAFGPNQGGISARSLAFPNGICVDQRTGNLWVADAGNNRVLCYFAPMTTDRVADLVIGQRDFNTILINAGGISAQSLYGPMDVALSADDVIVSDSGNKRVLIYEDPLRTGVTADHVLGQDGSFQTAKQGCGPFRFGFPTALTAGASGPAGSPTRILVSDSGNNRILMFDRPGSETSYPTGLDNRLRRMLVLPGPRSLQPIGLWGQGENLHTGEPNFRGPGPGALSYPTGMAVAPDGMLWVADRDNHRVLGFDNGVRGDRAADHVIGQIDLRRGTPNFVDGLCFSSPRDVAIDRCVQPNRLYVCDFDNNRILGYASTKDLGPQAQPSLVIGQPDVWSDTPGAGPAGLFLPTAIAVDSAGGLFAVDRENNRVLWFKDPFRTDTIADRVFGQPDLESTAPNCGGISARSLNRPEGVAVDNRGNLYLADTRNHRILRFDQAIRTDAVADAVWGQLGSFTTSAEYAGIGVRADTLSYPFGLDINPNGLLVAADTNNHRVLLFDTKADDPFTAKKVFGQGQDFSSHRDNLSGCSASSLSGPEGVAFWRKGLLATDTANCRMLFYDDLLSSGDRASYVYGQFGSFEKNRRGMGLTGSRNLWFPSGIDVDSQGNLYVADREQSRVLIFQASSMRVGKKSPSTLSGGADRCGTSSATTVLSNQPSLPG